MPAKILIAHQGTIPTYRVRFYEMLEQLRPDHWSFQVVSTDPASNFSFPTTYAPLRRLPTNLNWQNFSAAARQADILILDTHLSNIGYLLADLLRRRKCPLVLWGHTHNMNTQSSGFLQKLSRRLKTVRLRSCDLYFAYTESQAVRARTLGLAPSQIQALNNTLDIEATRARYLAMAPQRAAIRKSLGFGDHDKVLLVIGRLLPERRIEFLCDAFRSIAADLTVKLVVIGTGPDLYHVQKLQMEYPTQITAAGAIENPEILSRYFISADAFIMPGAIGLAPVEAICHDLPVIGFDLPTHGPEFDYLTPLNSYILPGTTSPPQFAKELKAWLAQPQFRGSLSSAYASIAHLRLQAMVENFIAGINRVLARRS